MRMRKLASLSAAAALAIGGASLMGGCQASNGDTPRSNSGGTYDNDASTAGSRTGTDEGGNYGGIDRSRSGAGNDTGSGSGTYGTGGTGTGTSGGTNGNDTGTGR